MTEKKEEKVNILSLGLFLGILSGIAAALLAVVAAKTAEPIKKAQMKEMIKALHQVLPDFDNDPLKNTITMNSKDNIPVTFYIVKKNQKIVGIAGTSYTEKGYGGKIVAMAGFNPDCTIRSVVIIKNNETPGLGTVVTNRVEQKTISSLFSGKQNKNKLPPNKILDQFAGHSATPSDTWQMPWKVKKDGGNAAFITGATISSRAVTDVVYRIASTLANNKKKLLISRTRPGPQI